MNKQYGFIPDTIADDHYVLGAELLPRIPIMPDGQWDAYLPPKEVQDRNSVETYNCTAYGSLNVMETFIRGLFGASPDFSERYVGILADTQPPGNSPHKVMETIRKYGVIEDQLLPFNDSIRSVEQYYSPKPMNTSLLFKGREWLGEYELKHEWVFNGGSVSSKQKAMVEALKYSPLGVSVFGWKEQDGLFIKPEGAVDNHWTTCYGYEEGKYWKIFDSYDYSHKKVAWNTDFMQAKRIYIKMLNAQKVETVKKGLMERAIETLKQLLYQLIERKNMEPSATVIDFCRAIKQHEGWYPPSKDYPSGSRAYRNNNPGNIRCNTIMNHLATGKDKDGFCKFPTEQIGFQALVRLVQRAVDGESYVYKPHMTIEQFFSIYAPASDKNDPKAYARFVAHQIGVEPTLPIKNLA